MGLVFVAVFMRHQLGDVDLQGSYSCLLLCNDPLLPCGTLCKSGNGALHVAGGVVFALQSCLLVSYECVFGVAGAL